MPFPPDDDPGQARANAARALTEALRAVADANERLQFAAAWVLDAFGDSVDAETVRMLMPGRRSGRPPVPPAAPGRDDPSDDLSPRAAEAIADLIGLDRDLREGDDQ